MNNRYWKTTDDLQASLRELDIREMVVSVHFTGPGSPVFSIKLRKKSFCHNP